MPDATIIHGDARHLPFADCSVDAVVCDPPYDLTSGNGRGFMGKTWDGTGVAFQLDTWREAYRVMKPGAFLVAFGGTRTFHRLTCAIEDAGLEIRDSIGYGHSVPVMAWLTGSGFPKSLDVSKAIDKAAGAEREVVGYRRNLNRTSRRDEAAAFRSSEGGMFREDRTHFADTAPATDAARRWHGFGTALKPAWEPIVVARKPLAAGTVAANVLQWGCGALNIDATRVGSNPGYRYNADRNGTTFHGEQDARIKQTAGKRGSDVIESTQGRWPTNVVFSHVGLTDGDGDIIGDACADGCVPQCPVAELDAQSGNRPGFSSQRDLSRQAGSDGTIYGRGINCVEPGKREGYNDSGGASRFFPTFRYQAKAPARERPKVDGVSHPTIKPRSLMSWLCRLVTPPGGTVLDPFSGSGTTLEAALLEGFNAIGVERSAEYLPLIQQRIDRATATTAPVDDVAELTLFDVA